MVCGASASIIRLNWRQGKCWRLTEPRPTGRMDCPQLTRRGFESSGGPVHLCGGRCLVDDFWLFDLVLQVIAWAIKSVVWLVSAAGLMLLGTVLIGIFVLSIVVVVAILF